MEPFFFGTTDQPLYGVSHQPKTGVSRDHGVVLVPPMGSEYDSAHRAYRVLADHLAGAGFSTLRFDFFGTGDSAGESDEGSIDRWTADIATAIDTVKASRDLRAVALVGLRLGGTLAAVAASRRDDVPALVLWEPIVSGAGYLEDLQRHQRAWLEGSEAHRLNLAQWMTPHDMAGYPLTESMAAGLRSLALGDLQVAPAERVLLIEGRRQSGADAVDPLSSHLDRLGARVERYPVDGGTVWFPYAEFEQARAPRAVTTTITRWIGMGSA